LQDSTVTLIAVFGKNSFSINCARLRIRFVEEAGSPGLHAICEKEKKALEEAELEAKKK